jgi:hypothetical protein
LELRIVRAMASHTRRSCWTETLKPGDGHGKGACDLYDVTAGPAFSPKWDETGDNGLE